ncbi:MAG: hypothetical protein A2136_03000 [Chloroflexi bacterium RBG_16_54_11]|nr:MAG: hypothetical protein A2136_03000 [Chloroflexi bacterium RBG_16_54_11]
MKNRLFIVITLLVFLVTLTGNAQATNTASADPRALVLVELGAPDDLSRFASTGLPMYARLEAGLLTGANREGQQALDKAGLVYRVIDPDLISGTYYLAESHLSRPTPDYNLYGQVLLETTNGVLLRMEPAQVDALTQAGAELRLITLTPKTLSTAQSEGIFPQVIEPDPLIQLMMDQVTTEKVYEYDEGLAGEREVWVDGEWYTIMSRNTYSGINIQKATSYVGQHMAALGLDVEYHVWSDATNPNVIGEIPGLVNPDDIFIIGGHLDDVQFTPGGADDNGSGSVAGMIAADILSQFQWGCTLRFAFWTGEEQGLLGSAAYANREHNAGANILGYLNLDMIAWNTIGSPTDIDIIYNPTMPPTQELAQLFSDVVAAYNINLVPEILTDLGGGSDHSSFWDEGYTSILSIEDQNDFNPYYHGPGDTTAHTDPVYFTNFVKASIGTFAHMGNCLLTTGIGSLDGHVTSAAGGAPIQDATVVAEGSTGNFYPTVTDATGYYTRTLIVDTYTVTASAYGFMPFTVSGVEVTTDTVTTQDFTLTPLPVYTVSGYVRDSVSNAPLQNAKVEFTDAPVEPVYTDLNGFYTTSVAEGTWTMEARADLHLPQELTVVVDGDLAVDFSLDPLPCILLVDDDADGPDVRAAYTTALDDLGLEYNVWDTSSQGNPAEVDIAGYQQVMWFTGLPWSGTFTADNEAAVGAYLDAGGNFFLSSQDYLYDVGLTPFGTDYLHILNFNSDVNQTMVTGQNAFAGLGPYSLSYPFTNYSDIVNPDGQSQLAFMGNVGDAAISFDGASFRTAFFGYPFEALPNLAARSAVMNRIANDFFGGCVEPWAVSITPPTDTRTGDPGTQVVYTYMVTNLGPAAQDVSLSVTGNAWTTVAPATTGTLDSGASATVPVTVTIPTDLGSKYDTFTLNASGFEGGTASATGTTSADVNPAVDMVAPAGGAGRPGSVFIYGFTLTNTGDYTDTFTLEVSSLWPAIPGGDNTGPLAPGEIVTVAVEVTIPEGALGGETNITTLTATSVLDSEVFISKDVITAAAYVSILPIMMK